jgi:hypothetical protein
MDVVAFWLEVTEVPPEQATGRLIRRLSAAEEG